MPGPVANSKNKRIIIDARESGTSTGRYVDKLVEYLHGLKPEFEFVILTKARRIEFMRRIAPSFTVVESAYKEFTFSEQLGFCWQLTRLKADLVHFSMVQQPVLYAGKTVTAMNDLTTLRFKNPSKNPMVFAFKQQVYGWVNKRAAQKASAIITFTDFVKKDVVGYTGVDPAKIKTIYLAADAIKDEPEPIERLAGKDFLMYVGRPMPHKNLERLIDAFALLQKTRPELLLVLAGKKDANYELIEAGIKARNVKGVVLTGFVGEGQLRWLYETAAAYVFPSLSEGFGLPGLEAMVHGAPVVSSNATCLPEVYGQAAHYFDPLDIQDMAAKIAEVLDNKPLRQKLIKAGYTQANKYSWRRMAGQTLEVYRQVLAGRDPA